MVMLVSRHLQLDVLSWHPLYLAWFGCTVLTKACIHRKLVFYTGTKVVLLAVDLLTPLSEAWLSLLYFGCEHGNNWPASVNRHPLPLSGATVTALHC